MNKVKKQRKFIVPEFTFGCGSIDRIAGYINLFESRKPLIVTDSGVVEAGLLYKLKHVISYTGIHNVIYDNITPNPKQKEVMEGAEVYNKNRCDLIIALGGGSVIDCAKGIGIVATNRRNILEFEGVDEVSIPMPPLVCLPTTAGAAADISQFAIIMDTVRRVKIAIISKSTVPDASIIDPELTLTKEPALTAATGMDVLTHAIEAYVSNASSEVTDVNAIKAIQLVAQSLKSAVDNPKDINHRIQMCWASTFAGMAFSNASLGLVHAMAHSLGGYLDLPHGECNAILLPHVIKHNFDSAIERYSTIAKALGINIQNMSNESIKENLYEYIFNLNNSIGIPESFKVNNISKEDLDELSENAFVDPCLLTNPKMVTINEIADLYAKTL